MTEDEGRAAVARVARSWVGTPYHHQALIKGVGCDCATLLIGVFDEAGILAGVTPPDYWPQWYLHHSEEKYLVEVVKYAHEVSEPKIGDIAVFKIGRTFSHGVIIVDPGWPTIVHAMADAGMVILDTGDGGRLAGREHKFFSSW